MVFALLRVAHQLEEQLESALAPLGLSLAKHSLLAQLVRANGSLTLTELAAGQRCVRSNITQLMDRLEADGLVRRTSDPADRRTVRAALTPEGRRKEELGGQILETIQAEVAARIPEDDRAVFERIASALTGPRL